jgi:hypothetical protein
MSYYTCVILSGMYLALASSVLYKNRTMYKYLNLLG